MPAPAPSRDSGLEGLRDALLEAGNTLNLAKAKAGRAKRGYVGAKSPDGKRRARRSLEAALGELRTATLEYEAAQTNLRRELSPTGQAGLDAVLARLERAMERYGEVSRLTDEVNAAYESARDRYRKEREAAGVRARIPGKFDAMLEALEKSLAERDKSLAAAHASQRRTLEALQGAMGLADEHLRHPTPSNKLRRDAKWAAAREAFADADGKTRDLTRALGTWFDADRQFGLAVAALRASRGFEQVQRLELFALDMLRASARMSLASIITDEALSRIVATIGELKGLR